MNTINTEKETIKLIHGIKCGNKKAQEKFYKYYRKKIELFIRDKYPANNEIEDNTSEILIKLFENIEKYDDNKSKFHTWVINIAKNHMIDKSRKLRPIYSSFDNSNITIENPDFGEQNSITTFTIEPRSYYCAPDFDLEMNSSLSYVTSNMNNEEFSMLNMKASGYNYKEIGKEFDLTETQVSNKINYTKTKAKKMKNKSDI